MGLNTYMYYLRLIIGGGISNTNIISERNMILERTKNSRRKDVFWIMKNRDRENIHRFLEDNASLDVIKAVANGESEKAQQVHQAPIELASSGIVVPEVWWSELNMLFTIVTSTLGSGTAPFLIRILCYGPNCN